MKPPGTLADLLMVLESQLGAPKCLQDLADGAKAVGSKPLHSVRISRPDDGFTGALPCIGEFREGAFGGRQ